MKAFKFILLYFFTLTPTVTLLAQSMSLAEAISIALKQNLDIETARFDTETARINNNYGMAGFYPTVNAQAGYTYSTQDITQQLAGIPEPNEISGASAENYTASVTAEYILFNGLGRIHNLRKLQYQEALSETQLRFTIENTLLQTVSRFYEVARLSEQLDIAHESVKLSLDRYQRAGAAQELGSRSRLELLNARVDLNTDSVNLMNARLNYEKTLRYLNQILNFPIDTAFSVDTAISWTRDIDYDLLRQNSTTDNAPLIQARLSQEITRSDIGIARSALIPSISANGGYNYTDQQNDGGFLLLNRNSGWQVGLTARWTLFDSRRNITRIETARISLEKSKTELEKTKVQLDVDLDNAYLDWQNNKEILLIEQRNLEAVRLNFERSQQSYSLGQINASQLREAQVNYITAKARINNLKYTVKIAEIELYRISGNLLQQLRL